MWNYLRMSLALRCPARLPVRRRSPHCAARMTVRCTLSVFNRRRPASQRSATSFCGRGPTATPRPLPACPTSRPALGRPPTATAVVRRVVVRRCRNRATCGHCRTVWNSSAPSTWRDHWRPRWALMPWRGRRSHTVDVASRCPTQVKKSKVK